MGPMAIFCSSDGSIRSLRALPHAALLARVTGEELVLGAVLDDGGLDREGMETLLTRGLGNLPGRVLVAAALPGESTVEALLRTADAAGARLIACDTRGAGVLRHALIGSVALKLLQESPVPMLMTGPKIEHPANGNDTRFHIALASDGGARADSRLGMFGDLLGMPGITGSVIAVSVPVLRELESAMSDLERRCRAVATPLGLEVFVDRAQAFEKLEDSLIRMAQTHGANAIGLGTANSGLGRHVLRGSLALATLNKSPLPVIVKRTDD